MRYAKSIYRCGDIVDSAIADYGDNTNLGIVCPFCSEPVFLRRKHTRGGIEVDASWCHYKASDNDGSKCELRASRIEGINFLSRLKSEARNQRLAIFNKHFWEICKPDRELSDREVKYLSTKFFGDKWIEDLTTSLQRYIHVNKNAAIYYAQTRLEYYTSAQVVARYTSFVYSLSEVEQDLLRLRGINREFHNSILIEVVEFLATPKSKFAFTRLVRTMLIDLCYSAWLIDKKKIPFDLVMQAYSQSIKNKGRTLFLESCLTLIALCDWGKRISLFMNK